MNEKMLPEDSTTVTTYAARSRNALPVPLDMTAIHKPARQWRIARRRVEAYVAAVDVPDAQRVGLTREILERTARRADWARGAGVVPLAMEELHRWFAAQAGVGGEGVKGSAAGRALFWFATQGGGAVHPALGDTDPRHWSFPEIRRTRMVPERIERRPLRALWQWLRGQGVRANQADA
jgi:hypothetical protein